MTSQERGIRDACPDTGTCHHRCPGAAETGKGNPCFRVQCCVPLGIAKYPGDRWPAEVLVTHGVTASDKPESDERLAAIRSRWAGEPTGRYSTATEERDYRDVRYLLGLLDGLPERETTAEYNVVVYTEGRTWEVTGRAMTQTEAEAEADRLFSHLAPRGLYNGRPFLRAEVVTRTRTRYADQVTDWTPVTQEADRG